MSVHFTPPGATGHTRHRTINHTKPYCTCADGKRCEEQAQRPRRLGRTTRRAQRHLQARRDGYDHLGPSEQAARRRPGAL